MKCPHLLTDAYDHVCIQQGVPSVLRIRRALTLTAGDPPRGIPPRLHFSNMHRDIDLRSWHHIVSAVETFCKGSTPQHRNALIGVDVQMNSNDASDSHSAKMLQALLPHASSIEMLTNRLGALSAACIGAAIGAQPTEAPHLRRLKLGKNNLTGACIAPLLDGLSMNSTLQQLHLAENNLGDRGAALLASAIAYNRTLVSLCLRETNLTSVGVSLLTDAIALNPHTAVTELTLKKNHLGNADCFTRLLKLCPRLTTLDVSLCGLTSTGVAGLPEAIQQNQTLRFLILSGNPVQDNAMAQILDSMCRPSCYISALYIEDCSLTASIAPSITRVLKNLPSLRRFLCSSNAIGDAGAHAIAEGLWHGSPLTQLGLSRCSMHPMGMSLLLDAASSHVHLRSFDISQNNMRGRMAVASLCHFLSTNNSVVRMHFSDNEVNNMDLVALAIEKNTSLRNCIFGGQNPASRNKLTLQCRRVINDVLVTNKKNATKVSGSHRTTVHDSFEDSLLCDSDGPSTPSVSKVSSPITYINGRPTVVSDEGTDPSVSAAPLMIRAIDFEKDVEKVGKRPHKGLNVTETMIHSQ